MRTLSDSIDMVNQGTRLFAEALSDVAVGELSAPSLLPGWSRAQLVAHLDGNARGLRNLVTWASTGVETPMYASPEQRIADIEAGAALPEDELRKRFFESASELSAALAHMDDTQWQAEVRTAQGRLLPATEIPWLRAREVMVHAVDLDGQVAFANLPAGFLNALIEDVVVKRSSVPDHPSVRLESDGHVWLIEGRDPMETVSGSLPEIAAYLTGRASSMEAEPLPAWL